MWSKAQYPNKNKPLCISCWSASAWKRRISNSAIIFCRNKTLIVSNIQQSDNELIWMVYLNIFVIINKEMMCFFSFRFNYNVKGFATNYATMGTQFPQWSGWLKCNGWKINLHNCIFSAVRWKVSLRVLHKFFVTRFL